MNTDEDLIKLARIAGAHDNGVEVRFVVPLYLVRFAALLRNHMLSEGWRQCAQGQKTTQFCGMVEQARLEEREAWPKLAPVISWLENGCDPQEAAKELRVYEAAIRARGQQPTEDNPSF